MMLFNTSRQLALRVSSCQRATLPLLFSRHASGTPASSNPSNPLSKVADSVADPTTSAHRPTPGDLNPTNIFEIDRVEAVKKEGQRERDINTMAAALDPQPWKRKRWERKQVIRDIKRSGRLTKAEILQRTEREHVAKSPMLKTSTKKLMMLARQIAGKPVEEAITQMRFSKKARAVDIREFLQYARDQAVVYRGMGLGKVDPEAKPDKLVVVDKDGTRRKIEDESSIYIAQAWVGRDPYGMDIDYRAKGRAYRLRVHYSRLYVVLKEEKTRIREAAERQAKRDNRKLWTQLPDRPITAQSQQVLW